MAKRKRGTTKHSIKKRTKEGRGIGRLAAYTPWLHIQDLASKGLATRIKGWKTHRVHHLMSLLELMYFYILEWSIEVVDIREQFPLFPQKETITIAASCGVSHPYDYRNKQAVVMTTDFNISIIKNGRLLDCVRTIKYSKDLASKRTLEKLEIERRYFLARNTDWGIVTEKDIPQVFAKNVQWLHPYRRLADFTTCPENQIHQIAAVLSKKIISQNKSLRTLTLECDRELGLDPGTSLAVSRHLLATRLWQVDMSLPLNPSRRLILIAPLPSERSARNH